MLTGKQKRHLRALAHPLKPVVQIGKSGFNLGMQKQIDRQLLDHELIKIRILESSPLDQRQCVRELEANDTLELVQVIGKTLVFFRPNPDQPTIQLPG
ncbi:MAG: ribosome assembly RNA-binding protein YhbY [SAR324 cluster bacterium]|nr:ribosome assembly RNA-binding protein YhbY [SAR324 cluster bacterium]